MTDSANAQLGDPGWALILPGGGNRGAIQAGALLALFERGFVPASPETPAPIESCGTDPESFVGVPPADVAHTSRPSVSSRTGQPERN